MGRFRKEGGIKVSEERKKTKAKTKQQVCFKHRSNQTSHKSDQSYSDLITPGYKV